MSVLPLAAEIASWTLLLSAFLAAVRIVIGPDIADRAVALDLLSVLVVAYAGLRALVTGVDAYLDVAAVLALTGFLGTLAFARFIQRRAPRPGEGVAGARAEDREGGEADGDGPRDEGGTGGAGGRGGGEGGA